MLDVFAVYATDEQKEVDGVEVSIGGGATITVARAENPKFYKAILAESELHAETLKSLPKEEAEKLDRDILSRVLAETILLNFKGLSYKGKALKYSRDNAAMLLGHMDFRKMVMGHANTRANFAARTEATDAKN